MSSVHTRVVEDLPKSTWAEEWNKRFHRVAKCVAAEGWFFEKKRSNCCVLLDFSNEYPDKVGASLVHIPPLRIKEMQRK